MMSDSSRLLQEQPATVETWKVVYTVIVLVFMFAALITEKIGADHVMLMALTAYMVAGIISIQEGLVGFSNQGLLTVLVLFVIAEGISKTGALDWYMTKLLGKPKTAASAQIRLMLPVAVFSAFLNNTPIVAIMIPIVLKWAKACRVSVQQLLIPLSFATILGGTCTLIGTSTNLVVVGLLDEYFDDQITIGLFDIAVYGLPVMFTGLAYILLVSPLLLPGGRWRGGTTDQSTPMDDDKDILLGARLAPWSPAVGRSVHRSGLRDTGGIFLVSVKRAATGRVFHAVSGDFILNAGDILYFTGLVESFGEFCEEHALEMLTNEIETETGSVAVVPSDALPTLVDVPLDVREIGASKESLLDADENERLRTIAGMSDLIHGYQVSVASQDHVVPQNHDGPVDPVQVVVAIEKDLVLVGINAPDRTGLLMDISKGLHRLEFELRHSEAAVIGSRSISVWRCTVPDSGKEPDLVMVWSVLHALLVAGAGVQAFKRRGLKVIRARVVSGSKLVGKTAEEVNFRAEYGAAIVSIRQVGSKSSSSDQSLSKIRFSEGDVLVLQASEDSPLLTKPFNNENAATPQRNSLRGVLKSFVAPNSPPPELKLEDLESAEMAADDIRVWEDLHVLSTGSGEGGSTAGKEFLTAMRVTSGSGLVGKSAIVNGVHALPELFLVSIERVDQSDEEADQASTLSRSLIAEQASVSRALIAVAADEPLEAGDILWFSGPASAVGDLRKIPGLEPYDSEEVEKMKEKVHNRRLVQAVVARNGPLVGKTVKEVRFRTRYGAAAIAIHREGRRVHDHPGNVKLQAGDVLLLEAGSSFMRSTAQNDTSFVLLAEVKDSAPPRLMLLIPALVLTVAMLAVYMAGVTTLLVSSLIAAMVMCVIGILSEQEVRDAVRWDVYLTIASAFGIGTALVNSGVAGGIATFLVRIGQSLGIGDAGVLGAVYFATFLISNVVTNNAAAALIFPIAIDAAQKTGTDVILMSYAVMLGASASFMTPYGYTTNLLIYGPGGYKYTDFLYFGTPMQIVLWIVSTAVLSISSAWYVSWIITGLVLTVVIASRVFGEKLQNVLRSKGILSQSTKERSRMV